MADDSGFDSTSPPSCFATRPDAAPSLSWPLTQESSEVILKISGSSESSGSPDEDDAAPRSAQPWLQAARRSDRQQRSSSESCSAINPGCCPQAQTTRRKRGCRGHGALQKRAQQRRQKRAAGQTQDQRAAQRRSGSKNSRLNEAKLGTVAADIIGARAQVDSSSSTGGGGSDGSGGSGGSGGIPAGSAIKGSDSSAGNDSYGADMLTALFQAQEQAVSGMAAAIQAQGEAAAKTMAGLTAAVQQLAEQQTAMTKSVSNFLFAQRQAKQQQRQPQRQDANAGKTAELQQKGEVEWCRIQQQAQEKLSEIKQVRLVQARENTAADSTAYEHFEGSIKLEFDAVITGLETVMQQEKDYQRCSYRRTACKALERYIRQYNFVRFTDTPNANKHNPNPLLTLNTDPHYRRSLERNGRSEKWQERGNALKYQFDHFGEVTETYRFLVDPGRFWSYDLVRSRQYGERPL